jgi:hypothetical protein
MLAAPYALAGTIGFMLWRAGKKGGTNGGTA